MSHHPDEGLLLRYIDGELPARKRRQVQKHLEACWQCRTEIETLQSTVADCVRYRKSVLETHLPHAPDAWPDLYREFARIDATMDTEPWTTRLLRALGSGPARRWGIATAALMVLGAAFWYQFRQPQRVEAAVLLQRAVEAAAHQPARAHRSIRIRSNRQQITRTLGVPVKAARNASAAELEAMFLAAHYDWEDPLSARAYQGWRDSVAHKPDHVDTVPDPQSPAQSLYQVRTEATDGELTSASLTLRATDLHPIAGRLDFRNQDWIELTEITEATTREDVNSTPANVEFPVRRAVPSPAVATPSGSSASISDELQVLAALHEIGADLGDQIEVQRSEGKVVVTGVGVTAERQRQIHSRLDTMPNVSVQFAEPAQVAASGEPGAETSTGALPAGLQARVEQQLGGRAQFERFSVRLLDADEAMMARAYALRSLAQRFTAETEQSMSEQDRRLLHEMARQHAATIADHASKLQRALAPVLTGMGATRQTTPAASTAQWQPAADELLRTSHRVEVLVSILLGSTPGAIPPDRLPSELLSSLGELQVSVENCQRLLAQN